MVNYHEAHEAAAALYDGGWRDGDQDLLVSEYGLTTAEAAILCGLLAKFNKDKNYQEG